MFETVNKCLTIFVFWKILILHQTVVQWLCNYIRKLMTLSLCVNILGFSNNKCNRNVIEKIIDQEMNGTWTVIVSPFDSTSGARSKLFESNRQDVPILNSHVQRNRHYNRTIPTVIVSKNNNNGRRLRSDDVLERWPDIKNFFSVLLTFPKMLFSYIAIIIFLLFHSLYSHRFCFRVEQPANIFFLNTRCLDSYGKKFLRHNILKL